MHVAFIKHEYFWGNYIDMVNDELRYRVVYEQPTNKTQLIDAELCEAINIESRYNGNWELRERMDILIKQHFSQSVIASMNIHLESFLESEVEVNDQLQGRDYIFGA